MAWHQNGWHYLTQIALTPRPLLFLPLSVNFLSTVFFTLHWRKKGNKEKRNYSFGILETAFNKLQDEIKSYRMKEWHFAFWSHLVFLNIHFIWENHVSNHCFVSVKIEFAKKLQLVASKIQFLCLEVDFKIYRQHIITCSKWILWSRI